MNGYIGQKGQLVARHVHCEMPPGRVAVPFAAALT